MRVFQNGKVFCQDTGNYKEATLWIDSGKIIAIDTKNQQPSQKTFESLCKDTHLRASYNQNNVEIIDCRGLSILPSCIDVNLFPLDKNLNAKTIKSLAKKALLGGVSTIFLNPYTQPSIDNEAMNALIQSMDNNEAIHIFPLIANLITTNDNSLLNNIDTLHALNDNARAIFSYSSISSNYLYQTMQYAKMLQIPLCVLAFDEKIEQGVAYESTFARDLGLPMITPIGQLKEVAKIKEMAKFLQIQVIFMSMNIASCIDMVCHEKYLHAQVGLPHLIFSERDIKDYDTRYKIFPPLLTRSKKVKLIKRLQDGKVALLTSMQSEISAHCKQRVFESADASVDGLEYFFSLAYTSLVKSKLISMEYLIQILSCNAAKLLGLQKGKIAEGYDADFMIVDLESAYRIDNPLSPYHAMEVYGKIAQMIIDGNPYVISL
ncbi:dihydroorotase [Helicobacter aurati]|uniref:Dihydroorotase n=1 Tax=Helicobacter aurati TaxID=137778 RepID=A0A3D8IYB6_9HELI|nr:amidohydrolase family protein [Helicobacter aurati]RDU70259.1 dihydroorotase [Helicobacter aurati]